MAQGLLPRLITEQRLDQYLQYLTLSDAQRTEIGRLRNEYEQNWDNQFAAQISAYNAKWNATYVSPEQFIGESMEKSFRDVLTTQHRLRYSLQAANDEFFDLIEAMLSDEQLPQMQRVRLAHERLTYRRSRSAPPRERSIDIVNMVEGMTLAPEERQAVNAVLLDFEPLFVQSLKEAAEADQRAGLYEFAILDLTRDPKALKEPATVAQYNSLQERREKVKKRPNRRLVELLRKGVEDIATVLSPEHAKQFKDQYNRTAYPEVYPDPAFVDPFFQQVLNLTLDESIRLAVQAYRDEFLRDHEKLSNEMAAAIFAKSESVYGGLDDAATQKIAKSFQQIAALGLKRERLNLRQPSLLRALLTPEQNQKLKPWQYEDKQPPRPWAREAGFESDPKLKRPAKTADPREVSTP